MRSTKEIRNDIRRIKRAYHKITCGELRDIFRRYGDKQIYLIDTDGNEVPGSFYRIHDFLHSYRWELHPLRLDGVKVRVVSIGSVRGPGNDTSAVKYLSKEAFGQWGGYVDVPVYICKTENDADPYAPAFGEYTICGDRVIFKRTDEAYAKYGRLDKEFTEARKAEIKNIPDIGSRPIQMPKVRRPFPKLFADSIIEISPNGNKR